LLKSRLIVVGSIGLLLLVFFAPALGEAYSFVFRDAAHFYHPLFELIRNEWRAGRVPLWNPYENIGLPLLAENTSSVFYPGKLIFALPLDYTLLYNVYVVSHVALAASAGYALARHFRASVLAAGVAGISYAFSGTVLFQYCNVVYLVGAAWLPYAVLLAEQMLKERRPRSAIGLGVVLAMMVTGGDPQMAYNAGLLAAFYAILIWRMRGAGADAGDAPRRGPWTARLSVLLAISAITCLLLAAVQMVPTLEAARSSGRGAYGSPRSVFELASCLTGPRAAEQADQAPWYAGLLDASPNGHQRQIYPFSVGPWRAFELLWPNVSGRQFPTHRRWLSALPAEGRVWVPSLYMGLLPFLLAAVTWSLRRSAPFEVRCGSWMVLTGALASMGIYGTGWVAREVQTLCGGSDGLGVGDEVGGLYWLMTVCLPGYVYFRYPAKLLVVSSLGLSLLAARGWDDAWQSSRAGLRRWSLGLLIASLLGLVAVVALWPAASARLEAMPADPLFGPFDSAGAWRDIMAALAQTAVLSAILLAILRRSTGAQAGQFIRVAALLITVADLAIAQRWLVAYAPSDAWRFEPRMVGQLPDDSRDYRVFRESDWQPDSWRGVSSSDRSIEVLRWDRETLRPRYQLPYGVSLVDASGSLVPYDYQLLWEVAREHGESGPDARLPHSSVLDLLAVRVAVLFRKVPPEGFHLLAAPADGTLVCSRPRALSRAWIVHQVEVFSALKTRMPEAIKQRTEQVLFPGGKPRDWSRVAVVESDEPISLPASPAEPARNEACSVHYSDPLRVEIDVRLASPGLVVISDLYDPGWECTVETGDKKQNVPILRSNRVMRGTVLAAGEHRLVYCYRPAGVAWGGAVSGVTAVCLAAAAVVAARRRRASNPPRG
jgi:hypothetical protein